MKVTVDRELCIGAANCVAIAPSVFQLDAENIAVINDEHGATEELLWQAAEACPTNAITLEDEDTGETLYP
jgi:ferredoxin